MGSILFRLLVALALRAGLDPNHLKLVTAVFVFLALVGPRIVGQLADRARTLRTTTIGSGSDVRRHG
jgi:putative tryptophan/tyrosine transport system permease protein